MCRESPRGSLPGRAENSRSAECQRLGKSTVSVDVSSLCVECRAGSTLPVIYVLHGPVFVIISDTGDQDC